MNIRLKPNYNLSILIVDDDYEIRDGLEYIIKSFNLFNFIIHAEDGREGLQKVSQQEFDIIITDINMPHLEGISLIESIRNNSKNKHASIILLSGEVTAPKLNRAIRSNVDNIITKPFSIERIKKTISKLLIKEKKHKLIISQT